MLGARVFGATGRLAAACAAASLSLSLIGPAPIQAQTTQPSAVCPPSSSASTVSAPSTPLAGQTTPQQLIVACVGSAQITEASLQHWSTIAQAAFSASGHRAPTAQEILGQVMGFLISADWIIGEARDLKIHVSPAKVGREFNRLRTLQFPKRGEFSAFLRETKQTVADLLLPTELELLSMRIQRRVVAGERGAGARERALKSYAERFTTKWLRQTYCAPQYAVAQCGHVQATL